MGRLALPGDPVGRRYEDYPQQEDTWRAAPIFTITIVTSFLAEVRRRFGITGRGRHR